MTHLELMNASFAADLKELLDKHDATIEESDEYDGHERFCGTKYTIVSRNANTGDFRIYIELSDLNNLCQQ